MTAVWILAWNSNSPNLEDCLSVATFEGREDCLTEALRAVTEKSGPVEASVRLERLLVAEPTMREVCHQPAHVVGATSGAPDVTTMSEYLVTPALRSCDWGVLHGILFRYAESRDLTDLSGLLGSCSSIEEKAARSACADSVGHVLWESVRAFLPAAKACRSAPDLLDACVSGVFMQLYSPVAPSGIGEAVGSPMTLTEAAEICDTTERDIAVACARASHYAYSQTLGPIRYRMSRSGDPFALFADEFTPAYEAGVAFCGEFPQPGASFCTQELSRFALQLLLGFKNNEMLSSVCSSTPEIASEYCINALKSFTEADSQS